MTSNTGCLRPCGYTQYNLPAEPQDVSFLNGDGQGHRQQEDGGPHVSFESLVAEFGGALGMFLGFSFLMIWDWLELLLYSVLRIKKFINIF